MKDEKLVELDEARDKVVEAASAPASEEVPLTEALGRVLSFDVVSPEAVPGFDNSAMDGFAVRAADTFGATHAIPVVLHEVGESRAGHPSDTPLRPGHAIRISTGAAMPDGANAVVRIEDTSREGDRIEVAVEVEPGKDMRRAGEDISLGATVLKRGCRAGPTELGVLASLGLAKVRCGRRPRLHLITNGDELIEPGEPTRPGAVRNSNRYSIAALAERAGAEIVGNEVIPDEPEATVTAIESALAADIVVICGGVSVGEHDHVKDALRELLVEEVFWGIALKPGKPTWFGVKDETLVFGLPGNPVSAMVTFLLLVRPALEELGGCGTGRRRAIARLATDYKKQPGRAHAIRCAMELNSGGWHAWPAEKQGSHILTSMLGAHGLAILPAEANSFSAGDPVEVELLDLTEPLDEPF